MRDLVYQYQIALSEELTEELVKELARLMNIEYDENKYKIAGMNINKNEIDSVCMFRDTNNENRFIMIDTVGFYILNIVVRCIEGEHENIKKIMLKTYKNAMNECGCETTDELPNKLNSPKDAYKEALQRINVNYI